jgi:hypothetical protein
MAGRRGGTGRCKKTNCKKDTCVKAREKTAKEPSRVQFVLTVTSAYFNKICKNRKKDKQPETKEIDKVETNNEAGSKKNLLPYQTVTQKCSEVRVMFDRTILADPVQTKRVKCRHLNCEHQMDQIEYLPNC